LPGFPLCEKPVHQSEDLSVEQNQEQSGSSGAVVDEGMIGRHPVVRVLASAIHAEAPGNGSGGAGVARAITASFWTHD